MKYLVIVTLAACAYAGPVGERIVGGSNAQRGFFPQTASLQWCDEACPIGIPICVATIVGQSSVITAAHCITQAPTFGNLIIRAGILNINDPLDVGQILPVVNIILHPNFGGGAGPDDIAVLQLGGVLTYNTFVLPASLPAPGSIPSGNATLAGWGATSFDPQVLPDTLQQVTKNVLTLLECVNALIAIFGNTGPLGVDNLCSGPLTGGIGSCTGDSGAPLLQANLVIGVTSWAITPCGFPGAPTIYTRVGAYIDFILPNII